MSIRVGKQKDIIYTVHSNAAHDILAQVLRNLQHQLLASLVRVQGIENGGELVTLKLDCVRVSKCCRDQDVARGIANFR